MGGDKRVVRKRTLMREFRGLQDYDIYSIREIETKNKRGTREREKKIYKEMFLLFLANVDKDFFFYRPFLSSKRTYKIIISS